MYGYQSLTGLMPETDILKVNNMIVKKDATIGGDLEVAGQLILPEGAALDYVLKSDADGLATWQENTLAGDITGTTAASVQHHKWIGNWLVDQPYQKYNRVTHDHVEYRALFDNVGASPSTTIGSYSLYSEAYPAPAHVTQAPDSLHQEIALRIEPNQRGFLTHFKFYNVSLETVDIRIYAYPTWAVVHEQTSAVIPGWQTIELTSPVPVMARQSILAAMRTGGQPYAFIPQDFDIILNADPLVYVGNDATSTETVFWFAKPGHPSSPGNPPMNGGYFNRVYLIDVVYEVGRTWEVVLSDRPDTVYEEKAQPLHNKTDVDVVDLTVHNSAKFTVQPVSIFEVTPRYLVGTGENKDELRWATNLDADQISCRNSFYYENDGRAEAGKVLTCVGNTGACNWADPVQTNAVTMGGDVTGPSSASVINTLAGGTIMVSELLSKSDFPADLVYETKSQPLRNKTDVDVVDLTINGSMKAKVSTLPSGTYNIRYMVGYMDPHFNDCAWVNDLYAPIISAQSQLLYPVNASAGKILSCVDGTGLAAWIDAPSQTMSGDVTGPSSASVVNTLAGGTIPVNTLVTLNGTQTLKNKMLNDASNVVFANGLRGGNGWTIPLSGSGPTTNQVLSFNGTVGTWASPASLLPALAGDVTGTLGATTVNTLGGGTIPVNQLVTVTSSNILSNKNFEGSDTKEII